MRTLLLASAAILAMGGSAFAQNATGNPRSTTASNIAGTDTRSNLAPALPSPGVDMGPDQLLQRANQDLRAGRTGAAQEALEEAETRLLDRSTAPSQANMPDSGPRVDAIRKALHALANRDRSGAMQGIQMAMSGGGGMSGGTMQGGGMTSPGTMSGGNMSSTGSMNGGAQPMPMPANGAAQGSTAMPNGMNNNPNGVSGGGGNESSGPAQ